MRHDRGTNTALIPSIAESVSLCTTLISISRCLRIDPCIRLTPPSPSSTIGVEGAVPLPHDGTGAPASFGCPSAAGIVIGSVLLSAMIVKSTVLLWGLWKMRWLKRGGEGLNMSCKNVIGRRKRGKVKSGRDGQARGRAVPLKWGAQHLPLHATSHVFTPTQDCFRRTNSYWSAKATVSGVIMTSHLLVGLCASTNILSCSHNIKLSPSRLLFKA